MDVSWLITTERSCPTAILLHISTKQKGFHQEDLCSQMGEILYLDTQHDSCRHSDSFCSGLSAIPKELKAVPQLCNGAVNKKINSSSCHLVARFLKALVFPYSQSGSPVKLVNDRYSVRSSVRR